MVVLACESPFPPVLPPVLPAPHQLQHLLLSRRQGSGVRRVPLPPGMFADGCARCDGSYRMYRVARPGCPSLESRSMLAWWLSVGGWECAGVLRKELLRNGLLLWKARHPIRKGHLGKLVGRETEPWTCYSTPDGHTSIRFSAYRALCDDSVGAVSFVIHRIHALVASCKQDWECWRRFVGLLMKTSLAVATF